MQTCAGDWKAVNDYRASVTWTGIIGADGAVVALPVSDRPALSDPIFDANARLIAAAPELLAALKGALGALEQDVDTGADYNDADWIGIAQQRLEAAKAAIAKAEGAA